MGGRGACKPGSVLRGCPGAVTIHLGPPLPMGSSSQPGDGPDTLSPPIWPCSGWGLPATVSPRTAGSSYLPISPLPAPVGIRGYLQAVGGVFLWHFPSPLARSLGVTQHPVRWSPDFPLLARCEQRPPGTLSLPRCNVSRGVSVVNAGPSRPGSFDCPGHPLRLPS